MRAAIFFVPPADHKLTVAAAHWLGRDVFSGEDIPQPATGSFSADEVRDLTAFPRRYGFHATLKPPFRIAPGFNIEEIGQSLDRFCRRLGPIEIPALRVERLGSFFALTPPAPVPAINELADAAVEEFERFRAPATTEETTRRRAERLTDSQRGNLERWGYPYVFNDYRFHMTLTGEVPDGHGPRLARILEERFAEIAAKTLTIDALALFVEAAPPSDFLVHHMASMSRTNEPIDAA
ncbi:MAG: DUF1045 domain-containing protein [Bauldia sp.]